MVKFSMKGRGIFAIPAVVSVLLTLLSLMPSWMTAERRVYDIFLHLQPPVREDPRILLLNVDDQAIAQVGIWPWSRDIVANGLILLREFRAACTVLDMEYVDSSPRGVDSRYLEEKLPALFVQKFSGLKENTTGLLSAIGSGNIPPEAAPEYASALAEMTDTLRRDLAAAVERIAMDNDSYLGKAARANGSTFFTVNLIEDEIRLHHVSEELERYVAERIPVRVLNGSRKGGTPFARRSTIQPVIYPIVTGGRGAGFTNVEVDDDGVRRRIDLIIEYDGKTYGQLMLPPLLHYLGDPEIVLAGKRLILKAARFPDGAVRDIAIPLSRSGKMLINWPAKKFADSFRSLSFKTLVVHDMLFDNLASNLDVMEEAGYFANFQGKSPTELNRLARELRFDILEGRRPPSDMEEFIRIRKEFLEESSRFLDGTAVKTLLDQIESLLSLPNLDAGTKASHSKLGDEVRASFAAVKSDYDGLMQIRSRLAAEIPGSLAIVGLTGISTSDIGVNPFEKNYMNVGTQAAVANTILTGSFLTELPLPVSTLVTVLLSFALTWLIVKREPKTCIFVGAVMLALTALAGLIVFILFNTYLPILTPLLGLAMTGLGVSIVKFIVSEGEKSFLRNAFSRYLSSEVIKQLLQEPERLKLGGEKKNLSVIFTDIKGFSGISEKLDPERLVGLLNEYLTAMSDVILEEAGTIDKYEGDAIISFFGAPVAFDDHPRRACRAAIRMKRAEKALNERLMREGKMDSPLLTRIGINSGEMVVGNMGTPRKMDYTVMGGTVNLASRLEGVNKQYGTWILTTESVIARAGDGFLTRRLDRVRVIGIDAPVRLYEVLEENAAADESLPAGLEIFRRALELFENRRWEEAESTFAEALAVLPGDGPSTAFLNRCREYRTREPSESWDGVFNLTTK